MLKIIGWLLVGIGGLMMLSIIMVEPGIVFIGVGALVILTGGYLSRQRERSEHEAWERATYRQSEQSSSPQGSGPQSGRVSNSIFGR